MEKSSRNFRWLASRQSVTIQGYEIKDGLVYVGETARGGEDTSGDFGVIDPSLEALPGDPHQVAHESRRWQRYALIPPEMRGAYLKWLADGRSDPRADAGYLYLYFQGLERRLLVDGLEEGIPIPAGERAEIVREVLRLVEIYGERHAFAEYAGNLIFMEWAMYRHDKPVPDCIVFGAEYRAVPYNIALADHAARNKPIPPELALQWIDFHADRRLEEAPGRCAKLIKELFFHRYRQKYGEGLVVKPENRPLFVENLAAYHVTLGRRRLPVPGLRRIARPFDLKTKLDALVDSCVQELDPYSGFVRLHDDQHDSLTALLLLPEDLKARSQVVQTARSRLAQLCAKGAGIVSVAGLYEFLGEKPPRRIRDGDAEHLAVLVEGVGFGLAPDIRFHNMKPGPGGKAAIFADGHGTNFSASGEFRTVCATLPLGAMISRIDGDPSRSSKAVLRTMVTGNDLLTRTEKDSLLALLEWCLATPPRPSGVRKRLAGIDRNGMAAIRHALVRVAVADGTIEPTKIKRLEKLYPILGSEQRQVASDLHALETGEEPVTPGRGDPGPSVPDTASTARSSGRRHQSEHEVQPSANRRTCGQGDAVSGEQRKGPEAAAMQAEGRDDFGLNQELLRRRTEETRQARKVLGEVFDERDEAPAAGSIDETDPSSRSLFGSLDQAHRDLFHRLIQWEEWKRSGIERLCEELGLMADGAMETLNEWFFDHANAPLIEDGEPVRIDVEGAREILDADRQQEAASSEPP